jgi:ribonuclease Z
MELSVLFAGTAGSAPSARRGLPALLIRYGGERILIDCGEGTQRQLLRSVGLERADRRLHHPPARRPLARAAGLLQTFDLRDRDTTAPIHGPPGS